MGALLIDIELFIELSNAYSFHAFYSVINMIDVYLQRSK